MVGPGKKGAAAKKEKAEKPAGEKAPKTKTPKEGGVKKGGNRKKSNYSSYSTYIYKVLKQVHPDTGVSKKAMVVMDSFVHGIFSLLANLFTFTSPYLRK